MAEVVNQELLDALVAKFGEVKGRAAYEKIISVKTQSAKTVKAK